MALSELNDEERLALMKLAYMDRPSGFEIGDSLKDGLADLELAGTPQWVIEAIEESENLQQLTLKDYDNQNSTTGFKAYAFTDETGDVGFSMCGTEDMDRVFVVDNYDNVASSVSGESAQTQEAWEFYERNRNPAPDSNWGFAHSKGSNLITEVFVRDPDSFGGVHSINGQPINVLDLSPAQIAALWSGKYDFAVVNGDIVSMFGFTLFPIRYVQNNEERSGFTAPHDLESALVKEGHLVTEHFPYVDRPLQLLVGTLVKNLVVGSAIAWAVGEVLVAVVEIASKVVGDVEARLQEFAGRAATWLRDAWGATVEVVQSVRNVIGEVAAALKRRMDAIGAWFAKTARSTADAIVACVSDLESTVSLLRSAQRDLQSADRALSRLLVLVPPDQLVSVVWADWRTGRSFRVGASAAYVQQAALSLRATERSIVAMAAQFSG